MNLLTKRSCLKNKKMQPWQNQKQEKRRCKNWMLQEPQKFLQMNTSKNKGDSLLAKAQKRLDEDMDDVKHMNQLALYSKVVTIRDK